MQHYVGCTTLELFDKELAISFQMVVMYPTDTLESYEKLGPFELSLAMNAAIALGVFPLVLISHGTGGFHLAYRTLARYLAENGFMVGLLEHPFNNRNNNSLENTVKNLANRPKHLRMAIDAFFSDVKFSKHLKQDAVVVIGHSMGGYTALALAGGEVTSFSRESPDGQEHAVKVIEDARIKVLVLLAPATVWFRYPGALKEVKLPILLLTAEKDQHTSAFHAQIVLEGVPDPAKVQHRIIENAGHFSFISPFPAEMTQKTFLPSQDPPGFDRALFHHELNTEILRFLLSVIDEPAK